MNENNVIQFIGLKWVADKPMFCVCKNSKIEFIEIPKTINIHKTGIKKCRGYYDLYERLYKPCPHAKDLTNSKFPQCIDCQNMGGFYKCLGCDGTECSTDFGKAIDFCNQPHVCYLAYFPNGLFKVGTAAEYRNTERLLEQGALFSIFFAKTPNGKIARQIESSVSEMGFIKSVQMSYKLKNLWFDKTPNKIISELLIKADEIKNKIPSEFKQYIINQAIENQFTDIYNTIQSILSKESNSLDLFGENKKTSAEYTIESAPNSIVGDVITVIGEIILAKTNNSITAFNTKNMAGFLVNMNL